jgi:hypothetical protein
MKYFTTAVLLSCLTVACAGSRDASRVEPLLFLPQQREIALPLRAGAEPGAAFLTATCNRGTRGAARCSHVSIRLDAVLAVSTPAPEERNRILALLLGISDYNCAAFTAQAFGRKARLQTASSLVNSVSNALASQSERNASLVNMLNLAGKTANDVFGHPSQLGSAETAVELAIGEERRKVRARIAARIAEPGDTYALFDLLGDLAAYDETCSLQRGKELAVQAAALAAREEAERALKALWQQGLPASPPAQQAATVGQ